MALNSVLAFKRKYFLYFLIAMVWCQTILVQYFRAVVMRFPIIGGYPDEVITVLYIVLILLSLKDIKFHLGDLICVLSMILVFLLSPVVFPDTYSAWSEGASMFLLQVLPLYFIGTSIGYLKNDWEKIVHFLYILSIISVITRIFYYYTSGAEMTEIESLYAGDMDGAYNLLPHLCLILYFVIKKTNLLNVVIAAVGSVFLLLLGTRGAVLIEVICFVLMVIFFATWKHKTVKCVLLATAVIAFLYSPLFEKVLLWLYEYSHDMGLSVRIFDKFLNGEITDSSGRDVIADKLYSVLANNPMGHGLYADRYLSGSSYAHKIYLELWIEFGVIFGTLLFTTIMLLPVCAFFKVKHGAMKGFLIVLYCSGVLKLFLSGTYLNERYLFILLGVSCVLLRKSQSDAISAFDKI